MIYPPLHKGQANSAVASMKSGVRRALLAKGKTVHMKENNDYGDMTVKDVRAFKRAYGLIPIPGTVFGSRAWNKLIEGEFLGEYDRERIRSHNRDVAAAKARAEAEAVKAAIEVGKRTKIAAVALRCYTERWRYSYSQTRPYSKALFTGGRYYDCSSLATMIYYAAGMPDPNGRGYDGYGWTGTQDARAPSNGRWTANPQAGDMAFYGPSRYGTTHMAIHISRNTIISFGSNPVKQLSLGYRGDYQGSKTFI